jgi:uncharacterized protein
MVFMVPNFLDTPAEADGPLSGAMPRFGFRPSEDMIRCTFQLPVYREVIESESFRRLQDIRFLGAIDYLVHPNGAPCHLRHTRYDHSLGVAELALASSRWLDLSDDEAQHLVVAALVHDIGHAPLSHSLEPVFKRCFGIGHHEAGKQILLGQAPIGQDLPKILTKHRINPDRIIDLVAGRSTEGGGFLFSSPINIDTLEAISRSYTYVSGKKVEPAPIVILRAAIRRQGRDREILDQFWRLKDQVYHHIINGRAGLLSDTIAQRYMEQNIDSFTPHICFMSERVLKRIHGPLFFLLSLARQPSELRNHLGTDALAETITVHQRRFFMDECIQSLDASHDRFRYRQTKTSNTLQLCRLMPSLVDATVPWFQLDIDIHNGRLSFEHRSIPHILEQCHRADTAGPCQPVRR